MRAIAAVTLLFVLTGCCAEERSSFPASQPATKSAQWIAALSPQQVLALPPEHAKAILLSRAALEHRAKAAGRSAPEILGFRVTETSEGWAVYVQYVGFWDEGNPYPAPGEFSTVYIHRSWTVRRIVGGA